MEGENFFFFVVFCFLNCLGGYATNCEVVQNVWRHNFLLVLPFRALKAEIKAYNDSNHPGPVHTQTCAAWKVAMDFAIREEFPCASHWTVPMGTLYHLTKCGYFSSVCLWGLYDFSILSPLSFQDVVTVNHCWFQVVGLLFGPPFNKSSGKHCDFLPIYQTSNDVFFICSISLNTMTLQVESAHVYTSQGVPVSVTGIAQVITLSIDNFVDFVKSWDVYLTGTWKPATKWRQVSYTRYRRLGLLPIDRRRTSITDEWLESFTNELS